MILIEDVLVNEDIVSENFKCNLNVCKGACCIAGDYGAPLDKEELKQIKSYVQVIWPYLSERSKNLLELQGYSRYFDAAKLEGTPLHEDGACVYLIKDEKGWNRCAFEYANEKGELDFKKPKSCHLYPIRVQKDNLTNFRTLSYDRWEICSAACDLGLKEQVPLYQFLKEAIINSFGEEFFEALDAAAKRDQ